MSRTLDDFIAEARDVPLDRAVALVGANLRKTGGEMVGPCPVCGGKDRFSVNYQKNVWHCRGKGGGGDSLALAAYKFGHDLTSRPGLLAACADLLGRPVPDPAQGETAGERDARLDRLAEAAKNRAASQEAKAREQETFRARERTRAIGIWEGARPGIAGTPVEHYLRLRTGFSGPLPARAVKSLRFWPEQSYWHGLDDRGAPACIHTGPAMIAPFIDPDGQITGCHITWIDLDNGPKFRPALFDVNQPSPPLPAKKMRGHKKGSLIPVSGEMAAPRWMAGEGIETVFAFGAFEGFRDDTFYCATGDLGNMAGPADPATSTTHPELKKADSKGRLMPVRVASPLPAPNLADGEAFMVAAHVEKLILLADGDSELHATASGMARAKLRLARPGLSIDIWWPPAGSDFADAILKAFQRGPS